jgi:GNAT superfamily N-acetyltransferase
VRSVQPADASGIAAIDQSHGGVSGIDWWTEVTRRHTRKDGRPTARVGLVAVERAMDDEVVGYLLGQVRAFEFGSEACGWIYAVGVHKKALRQSIASQLFEEARRRFSDLGVQLVRTMVKRDDVAVLSFFRSQGFFAGPYVEMESPLPVAETR